MGVISTSKTREFDGTYVTKTERTEKSDGTVTTVVEKYDNTFLPSNPVSRTVTTEKK